MVVLSNNEFRVSTPRPLTFPRMRDAAEKDCWIGGQYSEFVKVLYTILDDALSQPHPVFELEAFATPKSLRKKKKYDESDDSPAEEDIGLIGNLFNLIKKEHHKIETMITFREEAPIDFLQSVFIRLSGSLAVRKYPSELECEQPKLSIINSLLEEILRIIRKKFGLGLPKHLEIDQNAQLLPNGTRTKADYIITQDLGTGKKFLFFVIEVKKELPRHGLERCLTFLKRLKEVNPERKVTKLVNHRSKSF